MKIKPIIFSATPIFLFGCTVISSDCPEPGSKIDNIDFSTMTLETFSTEVIIYDNNNGRHMNTTLTLNIRDGINTSIAPAFDQGKLRLDANGTRVNYAHKNSELPGGYGCPEWTYPRITVKSSEPKIQLTVSDSFSHSKSWDNIITIDASSFPIFGFSISNDTFALFVESMAALRNQRPAIHIIDDSTRLYGSEFNSNIDYLNQYFRLSDFSYYSDTSVSEVLKKRYWALVSYKQENVASLSSTTTSISYAKELPDSIAALINQARASRIPIR